MNGRRVLIDAGNTRLKWAVVEAGQWCAQGQCDFTDFSALRAELKAGTACFIASVTSHDRSARLAALLDETSVPAIWLQAEAAFGELTNAYLDPQQLGVDRWMGLIAARQRTCDPVLVVSAGTAMTVDALAPDGAFLGGVIVPGLGLMRDALRQGTAGVAPDAGTVQAFPRTTADAVHSGLLVALCGTILKQYQHLAEHAGCPPRCLLTGGDAEAIRPHLALSAEWVPSLVLEGIDRVASERMK